jgi:serine/threonine-protein kinase
MATTGITDDVRRAFDALIELEPATRARELERLAQADPTLAARVGALLEAAEEAPAFLEQPLGAHELVGHRAGPWLLEACLSRGGAGDVYRARRAEGGEGWRVALKVLRRAAGPELRARFEAEREALAALNHPFVVPLIDAGFLADGRPYLATRLVEGAPLDRHAAGLGLAARLALFLEVCAAVQHAHARLIAHCDLKPDNVLVTREGLPQLVDFGIARLVSAGARGSGALTPGYASPEQLAGEPLGVASDVWSLGVVLYELASGRRPFAGPPRAAPLAPSGALLAPEAPRATTPAPDAPEVLAKRLRGDFDALVARALALDPAARYPSVAALAQDVERFLARRPLAARPASRWRATWLFARRNRLASAALALALVSLGLGLFGLARGLRTSRAEARLGWRAHAEAAVAVRLLEDLARSAGALSPTALAGALDRTRAELARVAELGPESEGRLRLALGALYLESGRAREAEDELARALELARTTRGFGGEDRERAERLLDEARGTTQAQGSQPARSKNQ